jgi:uncharacterized iron-regulated membrane protein
MIRKTIFWLHLVAGVIAGAVILMMSFTGVVLTYERQISDWQDRSAYYSAAEPGQGRWSEEALIKKAGDEAEFTAQTITVTNDDRAPVILGAGRRETLIMNPYSGQIYAPRPSGIDQFLSTVRAWHRWFNAQGDNRDVARAVTGASNLVFLFLLISGLYLWLPAVYRWSTMRLRLWFHPNATSGKARDFNWHHVFGFWAAIPLLVIIATATVFYYSWANDLVYRLAGEETPQRVRGAEEQQATAESLPNDLQLQPIAALFQVAKDARPEWQTMSVSLPQEPALERLVSIDEGNGGMPQLRHSMSINAYSAEMVLWSPFSSQSAGRQARSWVRFLHTGEALGLIGQTVAGLASLAGVLMVWTGFTLAIRRFLAWRKRINKALDKARLAELIAE